MRIFGVLLIVLGVFWVIICFGGIMMMSRSVNMFTEAFLPSILGVAVAAVGLWMLARPRRDRAGGI